MTPPPCTLRPARRSADDAQLIFDAWGRYPENFARLTAHVFADTADAERYLARAFSDPGNLVFHIVEPGGAVVGLVKSLRTEHRAQLGYVVHAPWCGRGIASEALRALVERVTEAHGISRIWATCAVDNPASIRVLEKCGFEREATLKNWVTYPALGGAPCDNYSYLKAQR